MAEPHEVLGVEADASADEIGEAFRTLAQIYHPDKYMGAPPKVQEEANRRMKEVAAAHQTMMGALKKDVVYRTRAWTSRRKGELTEGLLDAGVPHAWDGDYLTVARQFKRVADSLVLRRSPHTGASETKSNNQQPSGDHMARTCVGAKCTLIGTPTARRICQACGRITRVR